MPASGVKKTGKRCRVNCPRPARSSISTRHSPGSPAIPPPNCSVKHQLRQAQRLESIGTLAAGVAHEIKSPIQEILSNTQFFKQLLTDLQTMQVHYGRLVQYRFGIRKLYC